MRVSGKHVLIAANPKSGASSSQRNVSELAATLRERGFQTQVITSLEQLQAEALRLQLAGELRTVVSAGGDGTIAALANLLPADLPLLIFPLGTENLLARHLGLTSNVDFLTDIVENGVSISMDVGRANDKLFLVMLSCGFDAEVVRRMHAVRAGHINRWSYARPILAALGSYKFPRLSAYFDGFVAGDASDDASDDAQQRSLNAAWFFVFNVPRYAAGLNFCPQADPTDGALDVCAFKHSGIVPGLGYLSRLWAGSHQSMTGFRHQRCEKLHIPAPVNRLGETMEIPFQIDGDPGGFLPLDIEVLPERLSLLTPAKES